jgi:UDP-N-acetylglucosamine:LPS N-acetylglucosamine transferase
MTMDMQKKQRRLLVIASGGGHWVQVLRLRPAFRDFDVAFVSLHPDYAENVPGHRFYQVADLTRLNVGKLMVLVPQLLSILARERPDVVVTTGSAPGLVALFLAKTFTRARTIWIDSIANCERMSSSGSQARRFADLWLTQWPQLADDGGPQYWGAVL